MKDILHTINTVTHAIWQANQPEAAGRDIALNMLFANVAMREVGRFFNYDMGSATPDDVLACLTYISAALGAEREALYKTALEYINDQEWA